MHFLLISSWNFPPIVKNLNISLSHVHVHVSWHKRKLFYLLILPSRHKEIQIINERSRKGRKTFLLKKMQTKLNWKKNPSSKFFSLFFTIKMCVHVTRESLFPNTIHDWVNHNEISITRSKNKNKEMATNTYSNSLMGIFSLILLVFLCVYGWYISVWYEIKLKFLLMSIDIWNIPPHKTYPYSTHKRKKFLIKMSFRREKKREIYFWYIHNNNLNRIGM